MGFRFFKLNPVYKSYLPRISSPEPHKTLINSCRPKTPNVFFIQATAIQSASQISSVGDDSTNFRIFKRWHMGHSHDHHGHHFHGPTRGSNKENENIFWLGLGADIGLSAGKALTGYLSGSTAIIADAAHSLSDVVLSGIALVSFKAARVPKDKDHPYGHGKFETLGATGISCMLLLTGGGIAWHAIDLLLGLSAAAPDAISHPLTHEHHQNGHSHNIDMDHPILALNMTILSIAIKEGLFWITRRAGEREGSGLMKANAWHHRADAVSSLVALIGVGGSILGMTFLDPLAGLVVSGMILKAGVESGYQSVMELVDAAIPQQELEPHRHTILHVDGVKGCHRLRGRRAGSFLYLDVHIEVDPFTSVSAAHHVGEIVRRRLHNSHPEVAEVFIHIDPSLSEMYPDSSQHQGELRSLDKLTRDDRVEHEDIDGLVSNIFSSKFSERMVVEHVTRHFIQGKILLQIEVSMPPDLTIRDAMEMAEETKKEILGTISNVIQVSVQLRLGTDHKPSNKSSQRQAIHG